MCLIFDIFLYRDLSNWKEWINIKEEFFVKR